MLMTQQSLKQLRPKRLILGEQGRDPQNPPHPTGKYTAEDLKKLSKQEIAKLFDEGKLNHLL